MAATKAGKNKVSKEDKDSELFLGIMSGTSLDGLDVGLFQLSDSIETLAHEHLDYSSEFRAELKSLCESELIAPEELMLADRKLAELSAQCVNRLLLRDKRSPDSIKAIGSHGQTIRHAPPSVQTGTSGSPGQTMQIGDPSTLAALTGIAVVADFRRADMARGGQGAPLAPAFHRAAFGSDQRVAIVNIGGMSNITILGLAQVIGFDCGPGNALMDAWVQQHLNLGYDEEGKWAASGKVDSTLLQNLLNHEFFAAQAPKSTGREQFNRAWLDSHLAKTDSLPAEDVQATLLELTARAIADSVQNGWKLDSFVVCGGGAYNTRLMSRLAELLPSLDVKSSSALGIEPDLVECCAFAWFAQQTLNSTPVHTKDFTGAASNSILGGLYRPA